MGDAPHVSVVKRETLLASQVFESSLLNSTDPTRHLLAKQRPSHGIDVKTKTARTLKCC